MMYVRYIRNQTKNDIEKKVTAYEKKFGMKLNDFEKKVVKGHEDELDELEIYGEYEKWKQYAEALKKKKLPEMIIGEARPILPTDDALLKSFTPERMKILDVLNEKEMESIMQLSELLKRERSSVSFDLKILEKAGLVKLKRAGRNTTPVGLWDKIEIKF
jgi:DNA-binding transcriptional ArsR family regulator